MARGSPLQPLHVARRPGAYRPADGLGDETYAGSRSFFRLKEVVQRLTGKKHIIPTHQGRAAEHILFSVVNRPDMVVPANAHFDTTRANCEYVGGRALDLLPPEHMDPAADLPFKGDIDIPRLDSVLAEHGDRVPFVLMTVTNNKGGGQPVSKRPS